MKQTVGIFGHRQRAQKQNHPADANADKYIPMLLAEFNVIRQEIAQTQTQMLNAHRWGVSFAAATTASAVYWMENQPDIFSLITMIITPLICVMAMFIVIGEADRFKRAADYIYLIEGKSSYLVSAFVRREFSRDWKILKSEMENLLKIHPYELKNPMEWEHWLRHPDRRGVSRILHLVRFASLALIIAFSQLLFYWKTIWKCEADKYLGTFDIDVSSTYYISAAFWSVVAFALFIARRISKGVGPVTPKVHSSQ